ncbi:MAG: DUF2946 family protein [Burkholderiales bacterium]|nr:DUF2946 family protein [Burkholderiales bacterium]
MDDIVKAALVKWPNVPHCHGWLALDARGDWYMRDDRCQAAGPFPQVKGSVVRHDKLREFIARNCEADASGAWFFQNGPQRVYLTLEAAPWVWRLHKLAGAGAGAGEGGALQVHSHTGRPAQVQAVWLDEAGRVFLDTDIGFGLVHTLDTALAADAIETQAWPLHELPFAQMPARFGYRLNPAEPA